MPFAGANEVSRYFFDIFDGAALHDLVGKEIDSVHGAQDEAARMAANFLQDTPSRLWRDGDWDLVGAGRKRSPALLDRSARVVGASYARNRAR